MTGEAAAWTFGGAALVVVGLGIAVAVLGAQLGRARASVASTAAELDAARGREQVRTEERDRALAELADERARADRQIADLEREAQACERAVAEGLPPEVLRERFRDLFARWGTSA